jgi:asparagine synthase (glutamine-hydrolysing)
MYAFAFFEKRSRRLLLARDPLGIKPLYIAQKPSGPQGSVSLAIASEVRALLASGVVSDEPDRAGLATLMAYGWVQEPLTFYRQIKVFPAASSQWWTLDNEGNASPGPVEMFWRFPAIDNSIRPEAAPLQVRDLLKQAVGDHLVADVPVGVFLSSGIDSTVMAAKARKLSPSIRTFTLGFLDQPDLSESQLARDSARELQLEHHDIQITSQVALRQTQRWFETIDQPSVDGLNTYMISQAVKDAGITVAISGLGGDELFCGYTTFSDTIRVQKILRRLQSFSPSVRNLFLRLIGTGRPDTVKEKLLNMGELGNDLLSLAVSRRRVMNSSMLSALGLKGEDLGLHPKLMMPHATIDFAKSLAGEGEDAISTISRVESAFYMRNMLLRDSDATSMQHSLEIRVPFLDLRVINYAYSIPGHIRCPRGIPDKHLLRIAFADVFRPVLLTQKKRGFVLPLRRWMKGDLRDLCEASLKALRESGLVEPKVIDTTWQNYLANPEHRVWSHAFLLCVIGEYMRTSRASRSGSASISPAPSINL